MPKEGSLMALDLRSIFAAVTAEGIADAEEAERDASFLTVAAVSLAVVVVALIAVLLGSG
jgi:hypothetical protein